MFSSRRLRPILQAESSECGLACLAMIFAHHRLHLSLTELRCAHPGGDAGLSLNRLLEIAAQNGFSGRAVRLELGELRALRLPAVLHWNFEHYVVLSRVGARSARVIDPAHGERRYRIEEIGRHFTGIAIELTPAADFEKRGRKDAVTLRRFIHDGRELGGYLTKVVLLALLLQLLALASPYYVQTVVDDVLVRHDTDFLLVLALGFGALVLLEVLLGAWRRWISVIFGQQLSFTLAGNVYDHLLRLPLRWFAVRQTGDIANRFGSVEALRGFLSGGLALAIIDGITAVAFIVIMWIYDATLSVVVLISIVLYLALRAFAFVHQRDLNAQLLASSATQSSLFLESIRGIATIRAHGNEPSRLRRWQQAYTAEINNRLQIARLGLGFDQTQAALFGVENVLVVYLGARAVIDGGGFTIGMLYAFVFYKNNFKERIAACIDYLMEYRLLGVHLERLGDIVGTRADPRAELRRLPVTLERPEDGLRVSDLGFAYPSQPPLIEGLTFAVPKGKCLALAGPSGCGKSTLLRILAGLENPRAGRISFAGSDRAVVPASQWRTRIALVTPDDALFSGSIKDNVSMFADAPDAACLRDAATATGLTTLLAALPLGWDTRLGEQGVALSAGQRQRIILSRALYRRPDLLLLDEATSHLDTDSEQAIVDALLLLETTIVLVSHRPSIQARAERVITVPDLREHAV
ncbi:MAG: peptidase domain-containing ABC transporter [Pseudomonadota bacterium]